jgi:ClpP class serine protease
MPVKESDKKIINAIQGDIYKFFKNFVALRRGARLSKNKDELFSGQFWSGKAALSLGLIDGIGSFYQVMEEKYGKDIEYKFISKEESWLGRKLKGLFTSSNSTNEIISQVKEHLEFEKFSL